jgi:hypothetical protein
MTEDIFGILINAGTEFEYEACLLEGEEIDLTTEEMARVDGRWYFEIERKGTQMDLSGPIVLCPSKAGPHLWRRPESMGNIKVCAEHALSSKQKAIHGIL